MDWKPGIAAALHSKKHMFFINKEKHMFFYCVFFQILKVKVQGLSQTKSRGWGLYQNFMTTSDRHVRRNAPLDGHLNWLGSLWNICLRFSPLGLRVSAGIWRWHIWDLEGHFFVFSAWICLDVALRSGQMYIYNVIFKKINIKGVYIYMYTQCISYIHGGCPKSLFPGTALLSKQKNTLTKLSPKNL